MRFKGKTAVVTGAASGIGEAIAIGFAKEGADVVFMDINEENAIRCAALAKQTYKTNCIGLGVDVSNVLSVTKAFEAVKRAYDCIDVLVSCAGVSTIVPMLECTEEIWDRTIDINLKGTFLCMQSALKIMDEQKFGSIICMSSQSGKVGASQYQAYCASKFGIIGLVQSTAIEFAKSGIRVNAICPGVIQTPLWDMQIDNYAKKRNIKPEEVMPYFKSKIPMGRLGMLQDVVNTTFFLASDDSAYLTGQSINVAGGQIM